MSADASSAEQVAGDPGSCAAMAAGLHRVAVRLRADVDPRPPGGRPGLARDGAAGVTAEIEALATALLAHAEALSTASALARAGGEGAVAHIHTILGRSHARLIRACVPPRSTTVWP